MRCNKPIIIYKNINRMLYPNGMEVPCGKCKACRIHHRREWTLRMIHELESWKNAVFITLTYAPEHLPENRSLRKKDLQLYWKRLRKNLNGRKIKYYAVGEYGDVTDRPHYHAIIYGVGKEDKDILQWSWKFGYIHIGEVTADSCQYVAQYVDKKFIWNGVSDYEKENREPIFKTSSLGFGLDFALKNKDSIISNGYIIINGVRHSIPRYYIKKYDLPAGYYRDKAEQAEKDLLHHFDPYADKDSFFDYYADGNTIAIHRLLKKYKYDEKLLDRKLKDDYKLRDF